MKKKSKFLQKSFWLNQDNSAREYMVLIELEESSNLPIGTSIVRIPQQNQFEYKYHLILN